MRIAVLGSSDSWYFRDLVRAASGEIELVPLAFRDLAAEIAPIEDRFTAGVDLTRFDALIVRTMPAGSLEQVVFRMDVLARLEAAGTVVINPPKAIEAAVDKYLASAKLAAAGLPTPRTAVCQTADEACAAFTRLGGDVVVKPLFGSEGRGLTRVNDEGLAQRVFGLLSGLGAVLYLQQFIPHHGYDLRVLVVGRKAWAMRRSNPFDWRTNVSRGARTEQAEMTSEVADLAFRAAESIGAPLAGIDLLPDADGRMQVLEVNAVPGWRALARAVEVDIAREVLNLVTTTVQARRGCDFDPTQGRRA